MRNIRTNRRQFCKAGIKAIAATAVVLPTISSTQTTTTHGIEIDPLKFVSKDKARQLDTEFFRQKTDELGCHMTMLIMAYSIAGHDELERFADREWQQFCHIYGRHIGKLSIKAELRGRHNV